MVLNFLCKLTAVIEGKKEETMNYHTMLQFLRKP